MKKRNQISRYINEVTSTGSHWIEKEIYKEERIRQTIEGTIIELTK